MKKFLWFCVISIILSNFTLLLASDIYQINWESVAISWVKDAPESWSQEITPNASPVKIDVVKGVNLDRLVGKSGVHRDTGVLYFEVNSPKNATALIGVGCDWYFDLAVNGDICYSTWEKGNAHERIGSWNHAIKIALKQGKNLLAFRVKRGSGRSWFFALNNTKADYFFDYNHPLTPVESIVESSRKRDGNTYEVIVLGDVHYDGEEYHEGVDKKKLNDVPRNLWAWKNLMPKLIDAAAAKKNADTKLIIQTGDLTQGDCNTGAMHRKMLKDALGYFNNKFGDVPFLSVIGNHDWRSVDGHAAYDKVMFPYYSKVLNQTIKSRTFYFTIDKDLYIFADFARPDIGVIEEVLAKNHNARYKFLISHGSVLPTDDDNFTWYMFGRDDKFRNYMRNLFLKHDLIVLSGHSHTVELIDCVAQEGRITQLICSSIWNPESLIQSKVLFDDASLYGSRQTKVEMQKRYAEFSNTIKKYWRVQSAGYFVLKISPDSVIADYYAGDKKEVIASFKLR